MNFILFLSNLQKLSGIYGIGRCGLRNYLQEHVNVIHVILIVHVHCQEKRGREGGKQEDEMFAICRWCYCTHFHFQEDTDFHFRRFQKKRSKPNMSTSGTSHASSGNHANLETTPTSSLNPLSTVNDVQGSKVMIMLEGDTNDNKTIETNSTNNQLKSSSSTSVTSVDVSHAHQTRPLIYLYAGRVGGGSFDDCGR